MSSWPDFKSEVKKRESVPASTKFDLKEENQDRKLVKNNYKEDLSIEKNLK